MVVDFLSGPREWCDPGDAQNFLSSIVKVVNMQKKKIERM